MKKLEKALKIISLTIGTITFGFLAWLMLVYQNFEENTAFIIGGAMVLTVFYAVYRWGYWFIGD
jgi:hypothetical protein